jgi:hypothetical protein
MTNLIRGKVARVLNSRELALNIRSEHGVREGMLFDVIDPKGEDIVDPETGDIIGSLERAKVRVEVISAQNRLSVASTYKKERVNVGGVGIGTSAINQLFLQAEYVTPYETLKTEERTWEDLSEAESYVKHGDPVVQVKSDLS